MQYNVAQLLKEPTGSTRQYELDEMVDPVEQLVNHVCGSVRFLRTHQGILVEAELKVNALVTCGRCLGEYPLHLDLRVEEEFFPMIDVATGQRAFVPSESEDFRIDTTHTLDLAEALRQYVITASPMKPLCDDKCAGLCQGCGANLNQEECQCGQPDIDPRWGQLAKLLPQTQN